MFAFFFRKRRRQQLLRQPLSDEWLQIIERNVAAFDLLSPPQRERLLQAVRIMVSERPFVGLGGLTITDDVKVTVAAQAALLLLGEEGYYFDRVPAIYLQPDNHEVRYVHSLGSAVLVEEGVLVEGQAFSQGEVRLAWDDVLSGGRDPADGENVVLHEFAHHLDSLDGEIDGVPPLADRSLRRKWPEVFDGELAQLRDDQAAGYDTFLHGAAAENRAELFAYSTECFFEQPLDLTELHPDLFACLKAFYKVDPRRWFGG